jgi:hypothetical protein
MPDACIGPAVGHDYIFSKLGKFITKAQIAYFTSEPSSPLADGLKKSDTDSLLEYFKATEEISYHTLVWDVPLNTGKMTLISSLNVDRKQGFAKIDHTDDPDFSEPRESAQISRKPPGCIKKPGFLLQLLGQTSMTFAHSTSSQRYFTATVPAIPTTQTIIY